METTQVAFIRGFVEKCASRGWQPQQISEALAVLQMNEMAQDPDFAAGFNKQANGLTDALGSAGTWLNNQTPASKAMIGAGVGGLGGLAFGGKHKLRNALLGATLGGGAGYGLGKMHENGLMAAQDADIAGQEAGFKTDRLMKAQDADIARQEKAWSDARDVKAVGAADQERLKQLQLSTSAKGPTGSKTLDSIGSPKDLVGAVMAQDKANLPSAIGFGSSKLDAAKQPGLLAADDPRLLDPSAVAQAANAKQLEELGKQIGSGDSERLRQSNLTNSVQGLTGSNALDGIPGSPASLIGAAMAKAKTNNPTLTGFDGGKLDAAKQPGLLAAAKGQVPDADFTSKEESRDARKDIHRSGVARMERLAQQGAEKTLSPADRLAAIRARASSEAANEKIKAERLAKMKASEPTSTAKLLVQGAGEGAVNAGKAVKKPVQAVAGQLGTAAGNATNVAEAGANKAKSVASRVGSDIDAMTLKDQQKQLKEIDAGIEHQLELAQGGNAAAGDYAEKLMARRDAKQKHIDSLISGK